MRMIVPAACSLLLFSCGKEQAGASTEPEEPSKPWDWEPDDPEFAMGSEVFHRTCHLCHEEGEEGAPRLTHRTEWESRSAKGEAVLIRHAIEGFRGPDGEMPARGGRKSHSDEEVAAAVRFMVEASLRDPE